MLYQGALYHWHTLASDLGEILQFIVPMAHQVVLWTDVTEMLDTRVSSKCCTYYRTSSGGLTWVCRWRKWLATANDTSNMKALVPKQQCSPSLPPLLWSSYTYFMSIEKTMELDQPPNMVNILVFCDHFANMSWLMWPLDKLQRLLLNFCGRDTSQSLEPWPSFWVIEVPILKVPSSKSCVSSRAYGRLGLHLIILKPIYRLSELIKHFSAW